MQNLYIYIYIVLNVYYADYILRILLQKCEKRKRDKDNVFHKVEYFRNDYKQVLNSTQGNHKIWHCYEILNSLSMSP